MEITDDAFLPIKRIGQIDARQAQCEWLIEGLWLADAAGIIGGQSKLGKSWLCLDMAVSVASGTACLGQFAVKSSGPTLAFMAEDDPPDVRKRVNGICASRGLDVESLDLSLITSASLYLDDEGDRDKLRRTLGQVQPKMLLLDPLVRIHRGNENDARDIAAILGFLREIQREYSCAVVLAHHANKRSHGRPGQGLRGSSDLHAFGDSNLYLSHKDDCVEINIEHRAAASTGPHFVRLVDAGGGTHLQMMTPKTTVKTLSLEERVIDYLASVKGPVIRSALRAELRVNNHRLGQVLTTLLANDKIVTSASGLSIA